MEVSGGGQVGTSPGLVLSSLVSVGSLNFSVSKPERTEFLIPF